MTLTNDQLTAQDELLGVLGQAITETEYPEYEVLDTSKPIVKGQVTNAAGFYVRIDGELYRVLVHKAHRVMKAAP